MDVNVCFLLYFCVYTKLIVVDLTDEEIIRLCEVCTEVGIRLVQTSTGVGDYNAVKQIRCLELMRKYFGAEVEIMAVGVETLDDLLRMRDVGVGKVGTMATEGILKEAGRRGVGIE